MGDQRAARARRAVDVGWERRLLVPLLAVSFLLAPVLLLLPHLGLTGYARYSDIVTVGSLALVGLAGFQARSLVRFVTGLVRREQVLRDASTALAAVTDRDAVSATALSAMVAISGSADARAWFVAHTWTRGVVTARSSDGADVPLRAEELLSGASATDPAPVVVASGSRLHRALGVLDGRVIVVVPIVAQGTPRALGLLAVRRAPKAAALQGLRALGDTLTLALDRLDLAEVQIEQRSERRLRSMVQHASDIICLLDGDLTVCSVSPAVETVLGIPPLELLGQSWLDIVTSDDRESARDLVLRASSGRPAHAELRLTAADGRTRIVDTTVTEDDDEAHAGFVLTCNDVTERRELEGQLSHQTFHDSLTGLANRALFLDRVAHAVTRSRRSAGHCGVLLIDLDDFKTVNDSLGTPGGDELLQETTRRIAACLGDGDTAARLGGDEFAVLLEDVDAAACARTANQLIEMLRMPCVLGGAELSPSASIGVALEADPAATAEDLLRNADLALYEAKKAGKSRWTLFAPEMHDNAIERLSLINELRHGLDHDEIVVYYQPVVSLADEVIVGFEALARWEHPTRGLLLPGRFIAIAEDTGLIHKLGARVLDIALADAARWQQRPGREALRMAVNVSGRQLQDVGIVETVRDVLARHRVDPATVVLEFTESVLLPGDTATLERIAALHELGVRLYLDDFGTGYSSLSYLQSLPVDGMKLAQEFVHELPETPEGHGLVRAILDLAENLGLDAVVAEGIERGEQRESLLALGYGIGQGFHLGRPQPAAVVDDLLERSRVSAPPAAAPSPAR